MLLTFFASRRGRRGNDMCLERGLDDELIKTTGEPIGEALRLALYFCIILHGEILPRRLTDALSPHSPSRAWFGSWPFRYILLCSPLGSVAGRGIRVRL